MFEFLFFIFFFSVYYDVSLWGFNRAITEKVFVILLLVYYFAQLMYGDVCCLSF